MGGIINPEVKKILDWANAGESPAGRGSFLGASMILELGLASGKSSVSMRPALEALEARLTPADLAGVPSDGEVLELFNRWSAAVQSGDPDRVTALYAQEAILLPTVANDPRRTPEAIRDYFVEFLALKPVPRLDEYSIRASETLADNSGLYTFAVTPAGQPFRVIAARFTFNYEKVNGEWLIIQHHSSALPKPDPDATTRYEIGALYERILGRLPDTGGQEQFLQQVKNGKKIGDVARAIWQSPENLGQEVDGYYQQFLGRAADAGGREAYTRALVGGVPESRVQAALLGSAEFAAGTSSQEELVSRLYSRVLGREADPQGLASHAEAVRRLGASAVIDSLLGSGEYLGKQVNGYYEGFLGRPVWADPAGLAGWIEVARAAGTATVGWNIASTTEAWVQGFRNSQAD